MTLIENQTEKEKFLEENVFFGLNNLNDGFDSTKIK